MKELTFDPMAGLARLNIDHLDVTEIEKLRRANAIVAASGRARPRYFDGRFLAAPDLSAEQDYFLDRAADMAHASLAGVIRGLEASQVNDTTVRIERGSGVTPAGELVVLIAALSVDLADVAEMQRLDGAFGLDEIPNESPRRRSGLFVLALRPVEYTANPIATYPTSITERRSIEDGDIVHATAVTLVPFRDDQAELDPQRQRARAAQRIFLGGASGGVPAEALPVAMLQLDRGLVKWVDPYLVRREVGPEHGGVASLGAVPRAVREAQVLQYHAQLDAVIADRAAHGAAPRRFAASEIFRALPAAGQLPIETLDRAAKDATTVEYRQLYFPPQVQVLMSLVPEDEVARHVEEAMLLPPIDLTASRDELGYTSVLVLLPAARAALFAPQLLRAVKLLPATPAVVRRSLPLDLLGKMLPALPATQPATAIDGLLPHEEVLRDTFAAARAAGTRLWYVRRRALRVKPEHSKRVQSINVAVPTRRS